ncbi:DNA polymerase III subunit delta [Candidatus Margulisiibacteriota bacterium]
MSDQIFLFYGDEDFLIQARLDELKAQLKNVEKFDGRAVPIGAIVAALQMSSLFAQEKLIVVDDVDLSEAGWDQVCPVLTSIAPGNKIVFVASKPGKRSKLYKLIDQSGEVCEFKSFADWEQDQVVGWIIKRTKSLGKVISRSAAQLLQETCGNSLTKLSNEIDKLVTYVDNKSSIEEEDVQQLASPGEINVFALLNALAEKQLKESLSIFQVLYQNKTDYYRLLGLLANQYRTMLMAKTENNHNLVAQSLGVKPFFVRKCADKARNFSVDEIKSNLDLLLQTDLRLKSGEQQLAGFELLIASLCRPAEA